LNTDSDQALNPFERIRRAIADKHFVIEQEMLNVTISCGVTLITSAEDRRDVTTLLSAADRALYEAKETGRNRTLLSQQQ
jgi:diguanylate cyclase (GGDEF)-like protein